MNSVLRGTRREDGGEEREREREKKRRRRESRADEGRTALEGYTAGSGSCDRVNGIKKTFADCRRVTSLIGEWLFLPRWPIAVLRSISKILILGIVSIYFFATPFGQ